jgi:hypothetical protein
MKEHGPGDRGMVSRIEGAAFELSRNEGVASQIARAA